MLSLAPHPLSPNGCINSCKVGCTNSKTLNSMPRSGHGALTSSQWQKKRLWPVIIEILSESVLSEQEEEEEDPSLEVAIMRVEPDTNGKKQVNVHYVNTPVPCVVEENFGGYYHDNDDFALAVVLQDQETVYQSLQRNNQIDAPKASSSTSTNSRANQDCDQSRGGNSSETMKEVELQLAMDEALARELQEVENRFAGTSVGGTAGTETDASSTDSSTGNGEGSSSDTSAQVARADDINPDNMTYEELQSLTEEIGTESRGLSDELISYLPSSTYKTGLFSRKDKHDDCVICCMAYKNRDKLITLPCQHQYHKDCIAQWLKINKACPVCNEEVFGS